MSNLSLELREWDAVERSDWEDSLCNIRPARTFDGDLAGVESIVPPNGELHALIELLPLHHLESNATTTKTNGELLPLERSSRGTP